MDLDKIEKRLDDAIKNGTEADVNYWRGYMDALKAMEEKTKKHGIWNFDPESADWGFPFVCSCCNKAHNHKEPYCPNCGAKMEGLE